MIHRNQYITGSYLSVKYPTPNTQYPSRWIGSQVCTNLPTQCNISYWYHPAPTHPSAFTLGCTALLPSAQGILDVSHVGRYTSALTHTLTILCVSWQAGNYTLSVLESWHSAPQVHAPLPELPCRHSLPKLPCRHMSKDLIINHMS